jgi:hypothetical protein
MRLWRESRPAERLAASRNARYLRTLRILVNDKPGIRSFTAQLRVCAASARTPYQGSWAKISANPGDDTS